MLGGAVGSTHKSGKSLFIDGDFLKWRKIWNKYIKNLHNYSKYAKIGNPFGLPILFPSLIAYFARCGYFRLCDGGDNHDKW